MSTLRPLLRKTLCQSLRPIRPSLRALPSLAYQTRTFSASPSDNTPPPKEEPKQDPRTEMLHATLSFVPQYGWSMESLMLGARAMGFPSVAHGLFPGGEAGLIDAYLSDQRQTFAQLVKEKYLKGDLEGLSVNQRVEVLTLLRLDMNKAYIKKWPEALAIMARPSNVGMSLKHLGDIVDDIWWYSGDRSPDFNWYTKRGSLAAIYSATELFMTSDLSPEYAETEKFLKRRLDEAAWLGSSARQLGTMLTFGAKSALSALSNRGGAF